MHTHSAGRHLIVDFDRRPSDLMHDEDRGMELPLPLNPNQFDAVVSVVHDVGPGVIEPDRSLGRALRARDWGAAADALLLYDRDERGVRSRRRTLRRRAERELFVTPVGRVLTWQGGVERRLDSLRIVWSGPPRTTA